MTVANQLRELRGASRHPSDQFAVLIRAAKAGRITEVRCAMPECGCPEGRGFFTPRAAPLNGPWAPSADRWPVPGRDGGQYRVDNVRLAHRRCNQVHSGRVTGMKRGFRYTAPRVLSPEEHERRVRQGKVLAELARTPEGRERSRLTGQKWGPVGGRRGTAAKKADAATPEGRARRLRALALGQQTHEQLAANAAKANCLRWAIGRGLPCRCGQHQ
jgi:hypothetical protein